jgi:hypothetical protein
MGFTHRSRKTSVIRPYEPRSTTKRSASGRRVNRHWRFSSEARQQLAELLNRACPPLLTVLSEKAPEVQKHGPNQDECEGYFRSGRGRSCEGPSWLLTHGVVGRGGRALLDSIKRGRGVDRSPRSSARPTRRGFPARLSPKCPNLNELLIAVSPLGAPRPTLATRWATTCKKRADPVAHPDVVRKGRQGLER